MSCPVWQNGIPQSMQRAPCCCNLASEKCSWNSRQSLTRSNGERSVGNSRSNSMNPVGLPMRYVSPAIQNNNYANAPATMQAHALSRTRNFCVVPRFRQAASERRHDWRLEPVPINRRCLISADASSVVLVGFKGGHQGLVANQSFGLGFL